MEDDGICKGCGTRWIFMGTGYCGPCLDKMGMTPPPFQLGTNNYGWDEKPSRAKPNNN
jgi:hypothetical protein